MLFELALKMLFAVVRAFVLCTTILPVCFAVKVAVQDLVPFEHTVGGK